jgi:energy-coupling factor transporter ATP-binding protein EcfA2
MQPGALLFLVGPNGSGKSNFLDAFRFVAESLRTSVDHAIRRRGGISQVRRRSTGHPTHFGMSFDLQLDAGPARYAFDIGAAAGGAFVISRESCSVGPHQFDRRLRGTEEVMTWSLAGVPPRTLGDRFALVAVSGTPEFRPIFDFLSHMEVYNLNPEVIREPQTPDAGDVLLRDGANTASALTRLKTRDPQTMQRLLEYLQAIVPGISSAERKQLGGRETIEFTQDVEGSNHPWRFDAASMSDGTLRALGVLVALFQGLTDKHVSMIGLEEPESALHPGAAGALRDALLEASTDRQVLVTSHSPELLDSPDVSDEQLVSVESVGGRTIVSRLDEKTRQILRARLYTAGELLKRGQLEPDHASAVSEPNQLRLFEGGDE